MKIREILILLLTGCTCGNTSTDNKTKAVIETYADGSTKLEGFLKTESMQIFRVGTWTEYDRSGRKIVTIQYDQGGIKKSQFNHFPQAEEASNGPAEREAKFIESIVAGSEVERERAADEWVESVMVRAGFVSVAEREWCQADCRVQFQNQSKRCEKFCERLVVNRDCRSACSVFEARGKSSQLYQECIRREQQCVKQKQATVCSFACDKLPVSSQPSCQQMRRECLNKLEMENRMIPKLKSRYAQLVKLMKQEKARQSLPDIRNGSWVRFYSSGQKQVEGRYESDRKAGDWVGWFPDGQLAEKGRYLNDRMVGSWTWWRVPGGEPMTLSCPQGTTWSAVGPSIFPKTAVRCVRNDGSVNGPHVGFASGTTTYLHKLLRYEDRKLVAKRCWNEAGEETENCLN